MAAPRPDISRDRDADLDRQMGQLFVMGFDGTAVDPQIRSLIEDHHLGAILLTAKNLKSADDTAKLVLELQTIARRAGHHAPLLIGLDQENGGVNSLFDDVYIRQFPSAMGVAATGSKHLARDVAKATAHELRAVGVNWILGPVLDVLTDGRSQPLGVRSVGDDPHEVAAYAVESMKGYQDAGLATCGKHFPSYGNLDMLASQSDVPVITDTLEQLRHSALVPFRSAISQGLDSMIVGGCSMMSHGVNVMHACLSEQVIQDLLRTDLCFQGVVVSDCLEMEALSSNIGVGGGTVMALKAGCDLILLCRSFTVQQEAINGLRLGVENAMISKERIRQSLQRVSAMKARRISWEQALNPPGLSLLSKLQPSHTSLSTQAYNKSITVVRDRNNLLPLSSILEPDEELLLLTPLVKPLPSSATSSQTVDERSPESSSHSETNNIPAIRSGEGIFRDLGRSLARRRNGRVLHTSYTSSGLRPIHETLIARASAVVVVTADSNRNLYQHGFTKHVSLLCNAHVASNGYPRSKPLVVVAVSSPYDFATDMSIATYVCTYDFTEAALQALVKVLYGELAPTGRLPGTLSNKSVRAASQSRQHWLVETFNEERDGAALDALLTSIRAADSPSHRRQLVAGTTASTFLLADDSVHETHLVVRNSSTQAINGFCATYFFTSTGTGVIGALLVDPARRRLGIGRSLHARAMQTLAARPGVKQFQLGSRIPGVYLGIPLAEPGERRKMRRWFAGQGWTMAASRPLCSMALGDVQAWTQPEGLTRSLVSSGVEYDLVFGWEYGEAILEHVRKSSRQGVLEVYKMALSGRPHCGIIRAKRAGTGAGAGAGTGTGTATGAEGTDSETILGTVVVYNSLSSLARVVPAVKESRERAGGISSPVISPAVGEYATLVQGLIVLGIKEIRKQGGSAVILDCVDGDGNFDSLTTMGFTVLHSFEELTCDAAAWS